MLRFFKDMHPRQKAFISLEHQSFSMNKLTKKSSFTNNFRCWKSLKIILQRRLSFCNWSVGTLSSPFVMPYSWETTKKLLQKFNKTWFCLFFHICTFSLHHLTRHGTMSWSKEDKMHYKEKCCILVTSTGTAIMKLEAVLILIKFFSVLASQKTDT